MSTNRPLLSDSIHVEVLLCLHGLYPSLMRDSDSLYHRLFSHPRMVEGLVRDFIPQALVADLDFSGLQRVNSKFHSERRWARRRESDVIWRLPTQKDSDIYLYLLIEFQSQSDRWMAVRTQVYQGLLWQHVIDEQELKAGARLPPLLLLVLYTGEERWTAATEVSELSALSPDSALWPWQPHIRYYLLDMGAFSKDELARRSSLVALLFRLEQTHSDEELQELLNAVLGWFRQHEPRGRLQELFAELVREAFADYGIELVGHESLSEIKIMLATRVGVWKQQWMAEAMAEGMAKGMAEGRAEGRAEGKVEGIAEALVCLLAERFGIVAQPWQDRIRAADLATLERWFRRAIVAPDLQSVFDLPR